MPKIKKTDKEPTKLEECNPGATKAQIFDALRILATAKPAPKKKS
jgi:hypothetical protein